ncbi:transcriptional regulator [Arachidicoccus ginsenosidimutans]|uniref:BlaI/MecI/CopY family transcriptional regulator n=1 Tax=Arachidicoccus sp. BS20 TaxID=1850526 RepID=UPI0007F0EF88|nr:BlaI/MecI/CopY family transcriptional regulator [Arachidicoccus sp. BS20]ANI88724.1 transcriptional regulator [Arachidicoccus sp. BS20]
MNKLTIQEEEALQAVFKIGEGNVKSILDAMDGDVPYTTAASTVKNLEKKGFLKSRMIGNTYLYKPAISHAEFKKKFVGNVVKNHFSNSYKELVAFFVEQKKLSASELKEVLKMIEKGK